MKSYHDFKKINESDEMLSVVQELEKQIDDLFDELRRKIHSPKDSRTSTHDALLAWLAKNKQKYEWTKLAEYFAIKDFSQKFYEALTTEEDIDTVLNTYRKKLKQLVRKFLGVETPPAAEVPAPKAEVPAPKAEVPAPKAEVPPKAAEVVKPEEEEALMKLGYALSLLRDSEDEIPLLDHIKAYLKMPFDAKHPGHTKDKYIQNAQAYLKQTNSNLHDLGLMKTSDNNPTKAPIQGTPPPVYPTKIQFEQMAKKQFENWLAASSPQIPNEILQSMTGHQFHLFIQKHDSDLEDAYVDTKPSPWTKRRDEIIGEFIRNRDRLKQTESIQCRVNKYKKMLQQPNRPEILLYEAAGVPLSERVNFYKKKLSCRDRFLTI
jgi:hypothetical protein